METEGVILKPHENATKSIKSVMTVWIDLTGVYTINAVKFRAVILRVLMLQLTTSQTMISLKPLFFLECTDITSTLMLELRIGGWIFSCVGE